MRAKLPATPPVTDAAIAFGLLVLIVLESRIPSRFPGPTVGWLLAAVLMVGPLAWRRSTPLAALAVGSAAIAVQAWLAGFAQSAGMFAAFLLATYSTAAHAGPRARAWGVAILIVVVPWYLSKDPTNTSMLDALPSVFLQAGAWGAGATVRRRHERAEAAEAAALTTTRNAALAAADERLRIAHELHDVVAHGLSVMVVQASTARIAWQHDDPLAGDALRAVENAGRDALAEMRRLLDVLRPDSAPDEHAPALGLCDLPALLERVRGAGVEVELIDADLAATPTEALSPAIELSLYRIVQEALTNVVKHVGATTARVSVHRDLETVVVQIEDDGTRHSAQARPHSSGGAGQVGMRERAAALGGTIVLGPRRSGGYSVTATIPIHLDAL